MGKSITKMKIHRLTLAPKGRPVYEIEDCDGNKIVLTPCTLKKCRKNEMKKSE